MPYPRAHFHPTYARFAPIRGLGYPSSLIQTSPCESFPPDFAEQRSALGTTRGSARRATWIRAWGCDRRELVRDHSVDAGPGPCVQMAAQRIRCGCRHTASGQRIPSRGTADAIVSHASGVRRGGGCGANPMAVHGAAMPPILSSPRPCMPSRSLPVSVTPSALPTRLASSLFAYRVSPGGMVTVIASHRAGGVLRAARWAGSTSVSTGHPVQGRRMELALPSSRGAR